MEPKRKIPREEWLTIAARHAEGESLASIARAYKCTPPAIGYIVRQGRNAGLDSAGGLANAASRARTKDEAGPGRPTDAPDTPLARSRTPDEPAILVAAQPKEGGFNFSLRESMTLEISAFLVAFDAVVAQPTTESFGRLREATDRLLRAAARIRIELERTPPAGAFQDGRTKTHEKK